MHRLLLLMFPPISHGLISHRWYGYSMNYLSVVTVEEAQFYFKILIKVKSNLLQASWSLWLGDTTSGILRCFCNLTPHVHFFFWGGGYFGKQTARRQNSLYGAFINRDITRGHHKKLSAMCTLISAQFIFLNLELLEKDITFLGVSLLDLERFPRHTAHLVSKHHMCIPFICTRS